MPQLGARTHADEGADLLQLKPRRNVEWETADSGRVVLLVPKFTSRWLRSWLVPLLARPNFRVKLDAWGTFCWQQCDGATPIGEIAGRMAAEFGTEEEALWERIARFMAKLEREGLVVFNSPETD